MTDGLDAGGSVLGRLLQELSWAGASIRRYRNGGLGYENVLVAEVFTALDFLPRMDFLGKVLIGAHGADSSRSQFAREAEHTDLVFLPPEIKLRPTARHIRSSWSYNRTES